MRFPSGSRRPALTGLSLICLSVGGCAAAGAHGDGRPPVPGDGPATAVERTAEPWSYDGHPGVVIHTADYNLHTTVTDPALRQRLPDLLEGALAEYRRLAPDVPASATEPPASRPTTQPPARPLDCFVFGTRAEWVDYTRRHTGADAYWYLKINRGGYTVRDWFVAYNVGDLATLSVAAHEGWHQFASRHFKGRLPPFLEEGIATMFEDVQWDGDLPRWRLTVNRTRVDALQRAVTGDYVYPLAELTRLHAGNVVALSGTHIEAFYAQDWAFATFLWSADNGRFRPALQRLIADTANGTVFDPTGVHRDAALPWTPAGVRPMLEHYLGLTLDQIDAEYQKFVRKVAFEDYGQQWE